jgi:hypothetical protein
MARQTVSTYDPKEVVITFGAVPIDGYADGTFVEVAPSGEAFTRHVGADGEVSRSKSNDNTHNVTVTLKQSSLSNEYLSVCNKADRLTGHAMLPLSITDLNGGTLYFWAEAWVEVPSWSFGKEQSDRAWVFHTGQIAGENQGGTIL